MMNLHSCITCNASIEMCIDEIEKRDKTVSDQDWQQHHNERMKNGCKNWR